MMEQMPTCPCNRNANAEKKKESWMDNEFYGNLKPITRTAIKASVYMIGC